MMTLIVVLAVLIIGFLVYMKVREARFIGQDTVAFVASCTELDEVHIKIDYSSQEKRDFELARLVIHSIARFVYIRSSDKNEVILLLYVLSLAREVRSVRDLLGALGANNIQLVDQPTSPTISVAGVLQVVKPAPDQRIIKAKVPLKHYPNQFYKTIVALLMRIAQDQLVSGDAESYMLESMRIMRDVYATTANRNSNPVQQRLPNEAFFQAIQNSVFGKSGM